MSDVKHERNPYPGTKEVLPELLKDIKEKAEAGKIKYGSHLQTHNGRKALADLYQEMIDACFYIKQELMERRDKPESVTSSLDNLEWEDWYNKHIKVRCFDNPYPSPFATSWTKPTATSDVPEYDAGPLMKGHKLVHGDRGNNYGHPYEDFGRTVAAVNAFLGHKFKEPLGPEDIPLIMLCVKLSRESNLSKPDNLVDAAGYIETWWMVKKVQEYAKSTGQMPNLQEMR